MMVTSPTASATAARQSKPRIRNREQAKVQGKEEAAEPI